MRVCSPEPVCCSFQSRSVLTLWWRGHSGAMLSTDVSPLSACSVLWSRWQVAAGLLQVVHTQRWSRAWTSSACSLRRNLAGGCRLSNRPATGWVTPTLNLASGLVRLFATSRSATSVMMGPNPPSSPGWVDSPISVVSGMFSWILARVLIGPQLGCEEVQGGVGGGGVELSVAGSGGAGGSGGSAVSLGRRFCCGTCPAAAPVSAWRSAASCAAVSWVMEQVHQVRTSLRPPI